MNLIHNHICSSSKWAAYVERELLPEVLDGTDLGTDVLELGPGPGVTTRLLAERVPRLTALEIDGKYAERLRAELGETVQVVHGDGTSMPLPDASFDGAVCLTMLHHVPSPQLQDRLFGEACRVLRPGGVFAGTDSRPNTRFRLIHLFDTMVPVPPDTLEGRLASAGFRDMRVTATARRVFFRARKPL